MTQLSELPLANINTKGIIFMWIPHAENLIIVHGGVRGSLLPTIYGKPYTFETFPEKNKIPSYNECIEIGKQTYDGPAWFDKDLWKQIKVMLNID